MIDFGCPKCRTTLRVADNAAGQKLSCPKCSQRIQVPESPEMRTMAGVLPAQKVATVSSGKEWFYQQDGKPCGPLTWIELKNRAATGELEPAERVWSEGMAEWQPGETVPNLFPKRVRPPAIASEAESGAAYPTTVTIAGIAWIIFGSLILLQLLVLLLVLFGLAAGGKEGAAVARGTPPRGGQQGVAGSDPPADGRVDRPAHGNEGMVRPAETPRPSLPRENRGL